MSPLAADEAVPAGGDGDSDHRARRILEERARSLARAVQDAATGTGVQVVTFTLGGQRYSVEARFVREVLGEAALSGVPGAPPAVLGVVNVRGEILPVADLGRFLGHASSPVPGGRVLVLAGAGAPLGVAVDTVEDLLALPAGDVPQPGAEAFGKARALVVGVAATAIFLDAEAILADRRAWTNDDRRGDGHEPQPE